MANLTLDGLESVVKQAVPRRSRVNFVRYHRHVVSSEAFSLIDTFVYEQLWKMIRKRLRKKSKEWLTKHYWTHGKRRWMFTIKGQNKKGPCIYQVIRLSSLGIKRYIKIKADANPYDPQYAFYFWHRKRQKESRQNKAA